MRRLFAFITIISILFVGCKSGETISNLEAAYNVENNSAIKYAAFASDASKQGVADMVEKFDKAADLGYSCAKDIKQMLDSLGVKDFEPAVNDYKLGTWSKNIEDLISNEKYLIETVYPQYAKIADIEGHKEIAHMFSKIIEQKRELLELLLRPKI